LIKLTTLNEDILYLNPFVIESIEVTPDTVIFLTNGKTIIVSDPIEYIIDECIKFYNKFNVFPFNIPKKSE
jgi:flagellar protein FlbD